MLHLNDEIDFIISDPYFTTELQDTFCNKLLDVQHELGKDEGNKYQKYFEGLSNTIALERKFSFNCFPINLMEERTRSSYINVPKTIKTGIFKKETIMEKVEQKEKYLHEEIVSIDGWLLRRFVRNYISKDSGIPICKCEENWDYYIGIDGKIYVTWSAKQESLKKGVPSWAKYRVSECLYIPSGLIQGNQNGMFVVLNGLIGALELDILKDEITIIETERATISCNFPISYNSSITPWNQNGFEDCKKYFEQYLM